MKIISKYLKLLPVFVMVLAFSGCDTDDDEPNVIETNTIVDVAIQNNFTVLAQALVRADLVTTLQGSGPFTVFAPTDAAFQELLNTNSEWNTVNDIPLDLLRNVLLNHVVVGSEIDATTIINAGEGYVNTGGTNASGNNLSLHYRYNTTVNPATVELNGGDGTSSAPRVGADVSTVDVRADNGIIHVINKVLLPPTVVDLALADTNFTSLVAALLAADGDLVSVLSGDGPFTVLAPNDAAFSEFLGGTALGDVDTAVLANLLTNHVLAKNLTAGDLIGAGSGYDNTLATGPSDENLSIYFDTNDGVTFNGTASVFEGGADIIASNGVIHGIASVIDLPTIATFATSNPALSNLVSALQLADTGMPTVPYIATVSDAEAGPFTVFAPTDDAFASLLVELDPSGNTTLGDLDPATVDAVLLKHIVSGNIQSSGLPNGEVATLGGNITADNTNFTLTDPLDRTIGIVTSLVDIQSVNGVVHVVDTVIRPAAN